MKTVHVLSTYEVAEMLPPIQECRCAEAQNPKNGKGQERVLKVLL